jgi:excisionase family DNA binding protein
VGFVVAETETAWARSLPIDQIPAALSGLAALQAILAARLTAERPVPQAPGSAEALVDAVDMAKLLGVHESWVRTEQRSGRLPFLQLGRYVRFRPSEVFAARQSHG